MQTGEAKATRRLIGRTCHLLLTEFEVLHDITVAKVRQRSSVSACVDHLGAWGRNLQHLLVALLLELLELVRLVTHRLASSASAGHDGRSSQAILETMPKPAPADLLQPAPH